MGDERSPMGSGSVDEMNAVLVARWKDGRAHAGRPTRSHQIHTTRQDMFTMAKERKGKEGASRKPPQWRSPAAEDINQGDTLQFYSIDNRFTFRVLSVEHGGEWIFGRDTRDQDERVGPIAVKRIDCMTIETAARVLKDLPGVNLDAPIDQDDG